MSQLAVPLFGSLRVLAEASVGFSRTDVRRIHSGPRDVVKLAASGADLQATREATNNPQLALHVLATRPSAFGLCDAHGERLAVELRQELARLDPVILVDQHLGD
jgi:hypothetical protein